MELRSKQNTAFLPTADLHIHLLCGVDDGARDEETMRAMVDAAYDDGTRVICATPHYHPGFFGRTTKRAAGASSCCAPMSSNATRICISISATSCATGQAPRTG